MNKEELENLKKELREEIKAELEESFSRRKPSAWTKYSNEYLNPKLDCIFENQHVKYQVKTSICTLVRVLAKKNNVMNVTEEELEKIEPLIEEILENLENR